MKNLLNERSHKLFKKLFENQDIDSTKYEEYSKVEKFNEGYNEYEGKSPAELLGEFSELLSQLTVSEDQRDLVEEMLRRLDYLSSMLQGG